jgi:diacylglycerol kinase family enzyme
VELACESAVVAYADGERVGELPLRIDVVPGALKVLI